MYISLWQSHKISISSIIKINCENYYQDILYFLFKTPLPQAMVKAEYNSLSTTVSIQQSCASKTLRKMAYKKHSGERRKF